MWVFIVASADKDEFNSLNNEVSETIQYIRSQNGELGRLQTNTDGDRLIMRVETIMKECIRRAAHASTLLMQLHEITESSGDKGQKLIAKRINNELQDAVRNLTRKANEIKSNIESSPAPQKPKQRGFLDSTDGQAAPSSHRGGVAKPPSPPPPYGPHAGLDSGDPLSSSRGQQQVHDEHDMLSFVERTNAMAKLEQDIILLNEVMRDINALVVVQGETIEWIENAIDQGQTNVLVANKQLVTAIRYKRCNRRLTCCIVTIVLVVLLIIILAIIIGICGVAKLCQKN